MNLAGITLIDILKVMAIIACVGLIISMGLIAWILIKIRRVNVPAGAEFFDALRVTPLSVVLLLDILDISIDIFSAPIAWVVLSKLGLQPLRTVTVVKDLIPIPGLDILPIMTIAWGVARIWKNAHIPSIPLLTH